MLGSLRFGSIGSIPAPVEESHPRQRPAPLLTEEICSFLLQATNHCRRRRAHLPRHPSKPFSKSHPSVRQRVYPTSVDTYHRLGEMGALSEGVELLNDIIITKLAKSPLHEYVAQMLMGLLLALLPSGFTLRPERRLSRRTRRANPESSSVPAVLCSGPDSYSPTGFSRPWSASA